MTLLFGNLTQDFVNFSLAVMLAEEGDADAQAAIEVAAAHFRSAAGRNASYLVFMGMNHHTVASTFTHMPPGLGALVCNYFYMVVWVYTSEVNAKRIRERYLQAVLRQDIQFFDKVGAGEVTTRIQTDTRQSLL